MKIKNILFFFVIILSGILNLNFVLAGDISPFTRPLELVESVPLETIFGSSDIRTTPVVWLDMVNEAKKNLDLGVFYICNTKGEPLDDVIEAIKAAGKRGVTVRIISDSKFYEQYPETLDELGKIENISVRLIPLEKITGGVMHAKYFIVDNEDVFLGSQNFDWKALNQIHEIGIRIRDAKLADTIEKIFNLDWEICESQDTSEILKKLNENIQIVNSLNPISIKMDGFDEIIVYPAFSPKGLIYSAMDWDETAIVNLIDNAAKEVCIQVMQYSTIGRDKKFYSALDNAIRSAAARGVKVKIIVANWSAKKPAISCIKSLALVPNVEIKISNIPEWSGGFISFARVEHCKYMVVDDEENWIGTSNWEKDYFYSSRNLSVIIKSKDINNQLKNIFYKDWNGPYTEIVDPSKYYEAPKIND